MDDCGVLRSVRLGVGSERRSPLKLVMEELVGVRMIDCGVLRTVRLGARLKLRVGLTLPLSEAAEAHRQLEGRETTEKILLMP